MPGGAASRAVLAGALDEENTFAPLELAIDACDVLACVYSVGLIAGPEDLSHRIIHVFVADDGMYAHPRLRFASEYVAARLVDKFALQERERLLTFLRAAEGATSCSRPGCAAPSTLAARLCTRSGRRHRRSRRRCRLRAGGAAHGGAGRAVAMQRPPQL